MSNTFTTTSASAPVEDTTSTLSTYQAAYDANADYDEVGGAAGVAKCKAFLTAGRRLLRRVAESGTRESHMRIDLKLVSDEMERARQWLQANDTGTTGTSSGGPTVTRGDFRNFRS